MTPPETVVDQYTRKWAESRSNRGEQYVPEKYQLGIVADYLRTRDIAFTTEARIFSYPIDILAVDSDDQTTIAIELKSRNVGRGIKQARRDADLVDYAYLALWDDDVTEAIYERVEDLSIGLMAVDDGVDIRSDAQTVDQQLCRKTHIIDQVLADVRDDPPVQECE